MDNFHHLLNESVEEYHPKLSDLIDKYKTYIINVYAKIKEIMVNSIQDKREKFSIVKDIYKFFTNYNQIYSDKINMHNIIQGNEEDNEIINRVCNYLLNLFCGIEPDEIDDIPNNEKGQESGHYNEILNIEDNFSDNNDEENSEDSGKNNNFISYDVFEPFIRKKKGKLKELI